MCLPTTNHTHPSLPRRVPGAWLVAVHCLFSLRSAMRATLNGGGDSSGDGDSRHQLSPAPAPPPSTKMLHLHTGPSGSGGDRTRLKNILVRTSSTAAQPAAESSSHRRQLWAARTHCNDSAQHSLSRCAVLSSPPGHMTEPVRPFTSTCTSTSTAASQTHPLSFTSLAASTLRSRLLLLLLSAEPLSCAQPRPVAVPLLERTHPDSGLNTPCCSCPTHTHSPSLSLHYPLRRLAHARCCRFILPSDRLACLLASIATHCSHHSFGFELCEFPRHHHPIPVSRDFTFTSGYLCFTLRRFTSQRTHHHARH